MPNKTPEIALSLSPEEVQTVLKALGHLPFQEVFRIIHKIHSQSHHQMEQLRDAESAAAEEEGTATES